MAKITKSDGTEIIVPDEDVWGPPKTPEELLEEDRRRLVSVKRWQIAGALEAGGYITFAEAKAWAGGNALPAAMEAMIGNSQYPAAIKKRAGLAMLGADNIRPRDIEFTIVRDAFSLTKQQAVDLFKSALAFDLG